MHSLRRRDGEEERGSPSHRRLDPDASAVRLDDPLHDRKAEAGAAPVAAFDLPEPVEQVGHRIGGNAGAVIGHPE